MAGRAGPLRERALPGVNPGPVNELIVQPSDSTPRQGFVPKVTERSIASGACDKGQRPHATGLDELPNIVGDSARDSGLVTTSTRDDSKCAVWHTAS